MVADVVPLAERIREQAEQVDVGRSLLRAATVIPFELGRRAGQAANGLDIAARYVMAAVRLGWQETRSAKHGPRR